MHVYVYRVCSFAICTDARSLIQWLLEFRAQDRPNLDQILKHPWLKTTSKPHSNKTMTISSHHHKTHITSSTHNIVSPSTNKHPLSSSTIIPKGSPCSPYRSCDGGGSPIATNTSYFTPPQDKSGVKYSVPYPSSPEQSSPQHNGVSTILPSVLSPNNKHSQNISTSSSKYSRNNGHVHHSQTSPKSNPILRCFVSPASRLSSSHYGSSIGGVQSVTGRGTGGISGGGYGKTETSRTQLQMGRKQAF